MSDEETNTQNQSLLRISGSGHIIIIDGIISSDFIERVLLFSLDASEEIGAPGLVYSGEMPEVKKSIDFTLNDMNAWDGNWSLENLKEIGFDVKLMDTEICNIVSQALKIYVEKFPILAGMKFIDSGFQIERYKRNNGFYIEHADSSPSVCSDRVLTFMCFLNTVDVGGEIIFKDFDLKIKPVQGRVILFPSTWTHVYESLIPISEDKYIINSFIYLNQ